MFSSFNNAMMQLLNASGQFIAVRHPPCICWSYTYVYTADQFRVYLTCSQVLTLYQMTNFRLVQIESICR